MIKSPKSREVGCFMFHRAIVADRVVERLRDRLSSGALFFVDLIFAHGVFFSRFVSVTLAILRGSWSMATTAAAHLSVFTGKLRLEMRMAWPMCIIYTSMVTYITHIYITHIYITHIYITHQNSHLERLSQPAVGLENVRTRSHRSALAFGVTPPAFPSNDAYADRRRQNLKQRRRSRWRR